MEKEKNEQKNLTMPPRVIKAMERTLRALETGGAKTGFSEATAAAILWFARAPQQIQAQCLEALRRYDLEGLVAGAGASSETLGSPSQAPPGTRAAGEEAAGHVAPQADPPAPKGKRPGSRAKR